MAKPGKKGSRRKGANTSSANGQRRALAPDVIVLGLAGLGMLITAYLTGVAWLGESAAFCREGGGCDLIQQSRWSTVLGLPVALWGFGLYAVLALIAWRMPATLKRWRWLWHVALVGVAVSVYLTVAGLLGVGAVCLWCLASLATISALFVTLVVRHPGSAPGMPWSHWAAQSVVVAVLVMGLLHVQYSDLFGVRDTQRLESLALHLEASGARYYGAYWCPSCQEQKRLFRAAAEQLPFVECSTGGRGSAMTARCAALGIDSYPTWIINGRRLVGVQTPEELAAHSGFEW